MVSQIISIVVGAVAGSVTTYFWAKNNAKQVAAVTSVVKATAAAAQSVASATSAAVKKV